MTRGVAKRDHAFPKNVEPTVFMMSNPLVNPPREQVESGGAAVSAQDNRWLRCDIKSISLIGNVLLRQLSAEAEAAETILFRDGKLTEASASNVFIVKGGVILSPPKGNLILPGITYDVIAELAQRQRPAAASSATSPRPKCARADEVWVTSSSKEVLPDRQRSTAGRSATAGRARCSAACTSSTRSSSRRSCAPASARRSLPEGWPPARSLAFPATFRSRSWAGKSAASRRT